MIKYLVAIALICIIVPAIAQNWHEADSLRKTLGKPNQDTARVNTLLKLAEFEVFKPGEFKKDLDSAAVYIDQAKNLYQKVNSAEVYGHIILTESYLANERGQKEQGKALVKKAISILSNGPDKYQLGQAYLALAQYYNYFVQAEALKKLEIVAQAANTFKNTEYTEREAYAYKMLGDLDTNMALALKHLKRSLALYQSIHYKQLQGIYDAIGAVYLVGTDYEPALNYQLKALDAAQNAHDTTMQLCEINNHIGITYFKQLEFDQAIKYFKAALHTAEVYQDIQTIYLLSANICNAEIRLKRPREVLNILRHTLKKYPTLANDVGHDVRFTNDYIQAYTMLKQYSLAEHYSDHLLDLINRNTIPKSNLSDAYVALITYFFASKQYSRELVYLKKNDTLTKRLGISTNISVNNNAWFRLDTTLHNYKDAVYHLLIHDKIQDSTFTATKNKQIKQLQVLFDTKQKEAQIKLLNQKAELDQSNLQRANLVKDVTIGAIVLVVIIAGLLYRQSKLRQKNNTIVTHKNELLQHLLTEKEWLLKEVHHRVKNNLHTVICLLESQAAYLENDALKAIENSQNRIYAMSLIHQKLYQSDDIKAIDMSEYIPELVRSLEDSFGTSGQIEFKLRIEPISLTLSHAIPLGLIINEVVTNSIKYAFPNNRKGEILISMIENNKRIKLELADNGIGMPEIDREVESDSLGLQLMKGLSEDIEADISFEVDNGTRITIVFEPDAFNDPDNFSKSPERKEIYV
jgi:two-component sensor histidine kinase